MFDTFVVNPLTNAILGLYTFWGEDLGLAIVTFTVLLKVAMLPLTIRQIRFQRKMMELQPKLQELQSKGKDANSVASMSGEDLATMRQAAGGCFGSLLTVIIQIPILIGLNIVIRSIASTESGDSFNDRLYFDFLEHEGAYQFNTHFLGLDLATVPSSIDFGLAIFPYLLLITILVMAQFGLTSFMSLYQRRMRLKNKKKTKKQKANDKKKTEEQLEKEKMQEDMQKMMQVQTKYMIPAMIGIAAFSLPSALGVYWLSQNIFSLGQTFIQNNIRDKRKPFSMEVFKELQDIKLQEDKLKQANKETKKNDSGVKSEDNKILNKKNASKDSSKSANDEKESKKNKTDYDDTKEKKQNVTSLKDKSNKKNNKLEKIEKIKKEKKSKNKKKKRKNKKR